MSEGRGQNFKRRPQGRAEILGTATGLSSPTGVWQGVRAERVPRALLRERNLRSAEDQRKTMIWRKEKMNMELNYQMFADANTQIYRWPERRNEDLLRHGAAGERQAQLVQNQFAATKPLSACGRR